MSAAQSARGARARRLGLPAIALACAALAMLGASLARGAAGDVVFQGCIANAGLSGCEDPAIDSLASAQAVAVSPDGASVYVASPASLSSSVAWFSRSGGGALAFEDCFARNGLSGCVDPGPGSLDGASGVTVSPDGDSVYVVAEDDGAISHFTRAGSGGLTFEGCIRDAGLGGCDAPANNALAGASGVVVSPDGQDVYVASTTRDSVSHLSRDVNGALTFEGCIADDGGSVDCADPPIDSLDIATAIDISPDGESIYVASRADGSVTHLSRGGDGALTFEGCIADDGGSGCVDPPIDSLDDAHGVAVSADGESVYVVSEIDDAVTHFERAADGQLTFQGCIADDGASGCVDPPIDALNGLRNVAVSSDGRSVYATANNDHAIVALGRATDGSLTFQACVAEGGLSGCVDPPIDSLDRVWGLAVSPDGANVYLTSRADDAVTAFSRELALPPPPGGGGDNGGGDSTQPGPPAEGPVAPGSPESPGGPVPTCKGQPATIIAAPGVPTQGTDGPDVIVGTDGPDQIFAGKGNDLACAGDDDDLIQGGAGADDLTGGRGMDDIRGNRGPDELAGGKESDLIQGGRGEDFATGNRGHDELFGGKQADELNGGKGNDGLKGGKGPDLCFGGPGRDEQSGCR